MPTIRVCRPRTARKRTAPQAPGRERGAKPVWAALVGAGGCTQTRTKSSWPRPRPARIGGAWCRCRHNISRRCMTRSSCPRSRPLSPVWSSMGGVSPLWTDLCGPGAGGHGARHALRGLD
jgi:hypothetical protein